MSEKNNWEVSKIGEGINLKKPECPLPSANKDLEEETRKKIKQIFKSLNDEKAKTDKELVERVKKSWKKFEEGESLGKIIYLAPPKKWSEKDRLEMESFMKWNPNYTCEQLVSEIDRLKNEKLRSNQTEKDPQKLEKKNGKSDVCSQSNNSNDSFLTGLIVGGTILMVIGLTVILVVRRKKVRKGVLLRSKSQGVSPLYW